MKHLEGLNEQQRAAAEHTTGPLMILAGAGAGKTKTITHRIAHLISTGVAPEAILAVTFTNKAAGEMRERVTSILRDMRQTQLPVSASASGRHPYVATFHALGVRLLRENAQLLGLTRSFVIWDRADSIRSIKAILKEKGLDKQYDAKNILGTISRAKGDAVSPAEFAENANTPWKEVAASVWRAYETALAREHALDFDDLLVRTLRLLTEHPDRLAACRVRWTHLLIDEYQDTNRVQYELAKLLAGDACNICVVGDIDQNIYSWRGADIGHLLTFEQTFPNTKVVLLEQNYRSTKTIINAANAVIERNKRRHDKRLMTENAQGELLILHCAIGEAAEAQFIAERTAEHIRAGTPPEEIAVLYRANFQSRALEEAFLHAGITYRVLGTRFFERKEVKDVLSYLRVGLNPESRVDIARIVGTPTRGIGKQTLTHMLEGTEEKLAPAARRKVDAFRALLERIGECARTKPVSQTLRMLISETGLEAHFAAQGTEGQERTENIKELVTLATKYDAFEPLAGAEKLIEDAALASEQDSLDASARAVSLMTVHAAKGLEFDVVFVTGLEEGLFPHERFDEETTDDEEERRLFYVALTRARKQVYLTHAATRMMYGTREITSPSPFIGEIEPSLIEEVFANPSSSYEEPSIL